MKTLIVYYSKTGHTERVAKDLSQQLGADLEKIIDKKDRSGIWGWIMSGHDAMKKVLTEIEGLNKNPKDYELIILGSPVWGWTMVPAIRTYIEQYKNDFNKVALFMTSDSTPIEKQIGLFEQAVEKNIQAHVGFNKQELKNSSLYQEKLKIFCQTLSK